MPNRLLVALLSITSIAWETTLYADDSLDHSIEGSAVVSLAPLALAGGSLLIASGIVATPFILADGVSAAHHRTPSCRATCKVVLPVADEVVSFGKAGEHQ